ncbi:hypothetical protein HZC53_03295 [Candidatus Uhrbacteria bacterium]|nr:hypothetical protein [Candidatus Uhrbacteria bacterium]
MRRDQPKSPLELMEEDPDEFKRIAAELMRKAAHDSDVNAIGWLRQVPCEVRQPRRTPVD